MIARARSARTRSASSTESVEPMASAAAVSPCSCATCTARAASRSAAVLRSYSRTAAACSRRRAERLLMTRATASRTANVRRYVREGEVGAGNEEEVEGGHARQGRHDRRASAEPGGDDDGAHQVDHQQVAGSQVRRHLPGQRGAEPDDHHALTVRGKGVGARGRDQASQGAPQGPLERDLPHGGSPTGRQRRLLRLETVHRLGSIPDRSSRFQDGGLILTRS